MGLDWIEQTQIYDYEHETNDKKRNINLIRDVYATDCERELKNLMSQ